MCSVTTVVQWLMYNDGWSVNKGGRVLQDVDYRHCSRSRRLGLSAGGMLPLAGGRGRSVTTSNYHLLYLLLTLSHTRTHVIINDTKHYVGKLVLSVTLRFY